MTSQTVSPGGDDGSWGRDTEASGWRDTTRCPSESALLSFGQAARWPFPASFAVSSDHVTELLQTDLPNLFCMILFFLIHLFIYLFIHLFLASLGLRCCAPAFSSCGERGLLFFAVRGLLIAVASLVAEHGL